MSLDGPSACRRPAAWNRRSRRRARSAGLNAITRAAASSMARGTPSRRWQISTTARALLSVSAKSALTCRARSTKRLTASVVTRRSMSSPGSPASSGGSAISCSPSTARPSRLVASTTTPGHRLFYPRSPAGPPRPPRAHSCPAPTGAACWQASREADSSSDCPLLLVRRNTLRPPPPRRRRDRAPAPTRPATHPSR